jgi:hypothetical protein
VFIVQVYQISQYVVPHGGIFLGKWRSSFAGISEGKLNVQSTCDLNPRDYPGKELFEVIMIQATCGHLSNYMH